MNQETVLAWIQKAENDLKTGRDELQTEKPATDTVACHAQQCAEKYLKAFLVFHGVAFGRTHDLAELIECCSEVDSDFERLFEYNVDRLTEYAVEMRYPSAFVFPSFEDAKEALDLAERVRDFVLNKLRNSGFVIAL